MAKYLNEEGLALYDAKVKERLGKKADADAVPVKVSELDNDAGYLTAADVPEGAAASATVPKMNGEAAPGGEAAFARGDHVHPTDTTRLAVDGDGSGVTVDFTPAEARAALESGDALAAIAGKTAKYLADLGQLAFRDGVSLADLDEAVQASLRKADTALQSSEVEAITAAEIDSIVNG